MSIEDYYQVIVFILSELESKNLVSHYQELIKLLHQAVQNPSPETSLTLVNKKKEVFEILKHTHPVSWDGIKLKVFYRSGGSNLIGKGALARLKNIFANIRRMLMVLFSRFKL